MHADDHGGPPSSRIAFFSYAIVCHPRTAMTRRTGRDACQKGQYDVVIVGAGPAGLATLSALQESYSLDHLTDQQRDVILSVRTNPGSGKKKKVCVIDPSGDWLVGWKENFSKLDIKFLRSPALAHPDAFDENALLAFAVSQGREHELLASGCSDTTRLRGLGEAYNGLWHMPSSSLFLDFCSQIQKSLVHEFVSDSVSDIQMKGKQYTISFEKGHDPISAKSVVLAMGAVGSPMFPKGLECVPKQHILHWKQLQLSQKSKGIPTHWKRILVVGGGLTAVQVAQLALKQGGSSCRVTLCSRRAIVEKHLDIGLDWVDRRRAQKCQSEFYHQPLQDRLDRLKEARGGGSVPPCYVRQVESLEASGRLQRLVGNPNFVCLESAEDESSTDGRPHLLVEIGSNSLRFDGVIVACGVQPDCSNSPVFQNLLQRIDSSKVFKGFPIVSEDLEWFPNIFVVGGMAALNLGPDAGNLMGARRGATIIANALDCRSWLREKGNIFANRYNLFASDDDSSSDSGCGSDDEDGPDQ